jgi:hypothetical protein
MPTSPAGAATPVIGRTFYPETQTMLQLPTDGNGRERRHWTRFPCGVRTYCQILAGTGRDPELVTVRDLSGGGIGLVFRYRVEPETIVDLDLFHTIRHISCQVPVRVVYVDRHPDGNFVAGGAFTRELSSAEVEQLL